MDETTGHESLGKEIERGHFARAVLMATRLGLPAAEVRDLQFKALWQIAAEYRNAWGTRSLAEEYGLSKKDVEEWLGRPPAQEDKSKLKALEPCYDHATGKYLSFAEWLELLLKKWEKISPQ